LPAFEVPVLRTARLSLRGPTISDFANSFAMWSDPVVTRFITGKPSTSEEAWARLLRNIGHWQAIGYGYWTVETHEGVYVGELGFGDLRREITPPFDGAPEMGWVMAPSAHGQGFAFEGCGAALAWRETALPRGESVCIISPENTPSLRLADKLGFRRTGETVYHDKATVILRREVPRP
jgi:RimJ/RimL family protein N-acetyltransferase